MHSSLMTGEVTRRSSQTLRRAKTPGALVKAGSSKTVPIFNTASVLQGLPETESTRPWLDEIGWVGQEQ